MHFFIFRRRKRNNNIACSGSGKSDVSILAARLDGLAVDKAKIGARLFLRLETKLANIGIFQEDIDAATK